MRAHLFERHGRIEFAPKLDVYDTPFGRVGG